MMKNIVSMMNLKPLILSTEKYLGHRSSARIFLMKKDSSRLEIWSSSSVRVAVTLTLSSLLDELQLSISSSSKSAISNGRHVCLPRDIWLVKAFKKFFIVGKNISFFVLDFNALKLAEHDTSSTCDLVAMGTFGSLVLI